MFYQTAEHFGKKIPKGLMAGQCGGAHCEGMGDRCVQRV